MHWIFINSCFWWNISKWILFCSAVLCQIRNFWLKTITLICRYDILDVFCSTYFFSNFGISTCIIRCYAVFFASFFALFLYNNFDRNYTYSFSYPPSLRTNPQNANSRNSETVNMCSPKTVLHCIQFSTPSSFSAYLVHCTQMITNDKYKSDARTVTASKFNPNLIFNMILFKSYRKRMNNWEKN